MTITKAQQRCLCFCNAFPGTRSKAFPFGYSYHFDAPGYDRAPFRLSTINACFKAGLLREAPSGRILLTPRGQAAVL